MLQAVHVGRLHRANCYAVVFCLVGFGKGYDTIVVVYTELYEDRLCLINWTVDEGGGQYS